jgi:Domain of unknown function (DUF5658)
MARLYRRWDTPQSIFGDVVVVAFLIAQCLDGVFTYLGVSLWGMQAEANPLVSSAMTVAGLGPGLAGVKLIAVGLGIALHRCRVHNLVALLTAVYVAAAIVPWLAMFLISH